MLTFSADPNLAERQMRALIFYLTAFGYIDGDFDRSEKVFIRDTIRDLVDARAREAFKDDDGAVRQEITGKFVTHFHEVFEQTDREVQALFSEVVAKGEKLEEFVYAKLKLKSYEIFKSFDPDNQRALLATIDDLIRADGNVHPAEAKFRDEVVALLDTEIALAASDIEEFESDVEISAPAVLAPVAENDARLSALEGHYSRDPVRIRKQAEGDHELIVKTMAVLESQRALGAGKLSGVTDVTQLGGTPFLDGHVYVHPTVADADYELIVLGDLHGCYSCLKAALMQSGFFAKLEAHRIAPHENPDVKLIFLGDYIDRGLFSYNGVLRAVMQTFVNAPDNVFVLRGNHEYYLEMGGRIYGGVRPAEAINSLVGYMPNEMFEAYMKLFEALPNSLLFDRTLFVHAGIPRDTTLRAKWRDLSSLNDPDIRFEMLWSDPSLAPMIPDTLQAQNARFPFGRAQFERFMATVGCHTMVRGHEKIAQGFATVYEPPGAVLLNLFSAGGADNNDLPADSSYREVTPMALTMRLRNGHATVTPWAIDYAHFNDPRNNAFFASPPEIEHRSE
ncbi:MAG TPA: metallophosphoesterase family protein [Kofleriaceae bacterium]|nr:metallophosphoesterase family protein [Kofleriaceae bacterium]